MPENVETQEKPQDQPPISPTAEAVDLSAAAPGPASQEPTPSDAGLTPRPEITDKEAGDKGFTMIMDNFNREDAEDLANPSMDIQEYLKRLYQREEREYEMLKEYKENDEKYSQLSDEQKAVLDSRLKTLDYNRETRDLQEQYMASLNDDSMSPEQKEAIAGRYNERQAELKEFRELMQNSEEFRDNEHMQRMRHLEEKLGKAEGMDAQNSVKLEMAEEMRGFKRHLLNQGEEGLDKIISFAERNSNNEVVQKSGMLDTIELIKKQREASRGTGQAEELENSQVLPNGRAQAGGTMAESEEAGRTAESQVARSADDGKGAIDPVRLEGGHETSTPTAPVGGPAVERNNEQSASR